MKKLGVAIQAHKEKYMLREIAEESDDKSRTFSDCLPGMSNRILPHGSLVHETKQTVVTLREVHRVKKVTGCFEAQF